jgi:hypothetical protein
MLNFLHYILQQPTTSLLHRIFEAQKSHPTKGDWVSCVMELVNIYDLKLSTEEIKNTKRTIFKNLARRQVKKFAFHKLLDVRGASDSPTGESMYVKPKAHNYIIYIVRLRFSSGPALPLFFSR